MPIRSRRGLRKLHKVLEDWISEDWGDSSDSDDIFLPRRSNRSMVRTMESSKSDAASSSTSEHVATSSEDERISSRMSNASSSATDQLPPPPKYESVIQLPVKDYTASSERSWDREVNRLVDDFDRKCSSPMRDQGRFSTLPSQKRVSSGAHSFAHEESTSSRGSISPPRSNSALGADRDFDWDRRLLSKDDFFRDSRLSRRRPFGSSFGGMRSAFGEDIDNFFGRGTFSTDWDTFFPEISFSDFGRGSSLTSRSETKSRGLQPIGHFEDFKVEVDVQGFEPHELLVKTAGQSLLVMAKSEATNGDGGVSSRNREFRELRREFTIPSNVNPTDITSNLTPEGVLVIEAPTREKIAAIASEAEAKHKTNNNIGD
uniref:uncharacterized protein LOC120335496 n=1 Tax=Styela clava TaxID=7725 RepID=UPI0019399B9B|nr:uncharacterized protein LOC120335496 [Styela clava]